MTHPTLRPLSFGEILDGAFTLYRRNFLRSIATSVLLLAGMGVVAVILIVTGAGTVAVMPGPMKFITILIVCVCMLALGTLPWSALTWQAACAVQGKPRPLGESLEAAGGGAMTIVGSGLIAFGVVVGAMFAMRLAAPFLQGIVDGSGSPTLAAAWSLAGPLGAAVLVLCVSTLFFGVVPAVLLEEKGPVEAIVRSVQLARGALLRIAGVLFVGWAIVSLPSLASLALLGSAQVVANPGGDIGFFLVTLVMERLLFIVATILTMPFLPSVLVLLYYDRRVRTEALDVEMLTDKLALAGA